MKILTSGLVVTLGFLASLASAAVQRIPLGDAANASRIDTIANDGRGGWLDEGANDLKVLGDGRAKFGGVEFEIARCASESDKAAIILDARCPTASLKVETPTSARWLYLLQASAGIGRAARVGTVRVDYDDGTHEEFSITAGRELGDWTSSAVPSAAVRAWSVYNGVTQVSLFVAPLELKGTAKLCGVTFTAKDVGKGHWMVLAASCGDKVRLKNLESSLALDRKYDVAPAWTEALQTFPAGARPRNVILLIGDGMGHGCQRLASLYLHGRDDALTFQRFPFAGFCTTFSANSDVTDSAAAGTAMASGYKTNNGTLGMRPDPVSGKMVPAISVAERAHAQGLGVGIISNDPTTGATPGAFYAHVPGRGMKDDILKFAADCGYEFAVGYGGEAAPAEIDGVSVPAEKVMSVRLDKVLQTLSSKTHGFFVMAESSTPDHGNHGNNPEKSVLGVVQVDWMARVALKFAEKRGDTLVLVTADHETGGVNTIRSWRDNGKITVHYSTSSHSGNPVPIYAYGPGAELFEGLHDNTEIAKLVSLLMGLK